MNIITLKEANKNIETIKTTGAKREALIHITALFAIHQVNNHGNLTALNKLVSVMRASDRKEAFKTWVTDHAKVVFKKNGLFAYSKNRKLYDTSKFPAKVECTIDESLELANSVPFWDYTKESVPASKTDVIARVQSLVSKLKKFSGTVEHKEYIADLEALLVKAGKPLASTPATLAPIVGEALM